VRQSLLLVLVTYSLLVAVLGFELQVCTIISRYTTNAGISLEVLSGL